MAEMSTTSTTQGRVQGGSKQPRYMTRLAKRHLEGEFNKGLATIRKKSKRSGNHKNQINFRNKSDKSKHEKYKALFMQTLQDLKIRVRNGMAVSHRMLEGVKKSLQYARDPSKEVEYDSDTGEEIHHRILYFNVKEIGRGTYGVVLEISRGTWFVCLKLDILTTHGISRVQRPSSNEVEVLRRLATAKDRTGLVPVEAVQTKCFTHLYVMPKADMSLHEFRKGQPALDRDGLRSAAEQLLSGLSTMHQMNCVHGDLSAKNILVKLRPGQPPLCWLCDFGSAVPFDIRTEPTPGGTTWYLHPEHVQKLCEWVTDLDAPYPMPTMANDVWGLGCLLYLLERGTEPFWCEFVQDESRVASAYWSMYCMHARFQGWTCVPPGFEGPLPKFRPLAHPDPSQRPACVYCDMNAKLLRDGVVTEPVQDLPRLKQLMNLQMLPGAPPCRGCLEQLELGNAIMRCWFTYPMLPNVTYSVQ